MKKKLEEKERKKPRWRERGRSGKKAELGPPRDPDREARPRARVGAHARSGLGPAPGAGTAGNQVGSLGLRALSPQHGTHRLPGPRTVCVPSWRGQTCRTRRSTFLKAARPPRAAQCVHGLPADGQWLRFGPSFQWRRLRLPGGLSLPPRCSLSPLPSLPTHPPASSPSGLP